MGQRLVKPISGDPYYWGWVYMPISWVTMAQGKSWPHVGRDKKWVIRPYLLACSWSSTLPFTCTYYGLLLITITWDDFFCNSSPANNMTPFKHASPARSQKYVVCTSKAWLGIELQNLNAESKLTSYQPLPNMLPKQGHCDPHPPLLHRNSRTLADLNKA